MECSKCGKVLLSGDQVTRLTIETGRLADGYLPIADLEGDYFICEECAGAITFHLGLK